MAKRTCPFDDEISRQRKIHVSDEDVNSRNETYINRIRERTINLLFQSQNNNNNKPSTSKQYDVYVENRLCPECRTIQPISARCWFCEISLCDSCVKKCSFCYENFCSKCAVAMYKTGNTFACLTCYS